MYVVMNKHGKPLVMNGGRYLDRFERRDGKWAIAYRVCLRDWAMMDERPDMNDLSTFTSTRAGMPAEVIAFMNGGLGPRRDRTDPSYQRPLRVDPERVRAYQQMKGKLSHWHTCMQPIRWVSMLPVTFWEFGGAVALQCLARLLHDGGPVTRVALPLRSTSPAVSPFEHFWRRVESVRIDQNERLPTSPSRLLRTVGDIRRSPRKNDAGASRHESGDRRPLQLDRDRARSSFLLIY